MSKLPYITPTSIKALLSTDDQCQYGAWFKAHTHGYRQTESDFDFAAWRVEHQKYVEEVAEDHRSADYLVTVEAQNDVTLNGVSAKLKGKMDIIARPGSWKGRGKSRHHIASSKPVKVIDVKTGKPRGSDIWQVKIYIAMMHQVIGRYEEVGQIVGELFYPNANKGAGETVSVVLGRGDAATIWEQVKRTAQPTAEPATPSLQECRFCNIADCPDRMAPDQTAEVEAKELF